MNLRRILHKVVVTVQEKAGAPMSLAVEDVLGHDQVSGLVIAKEATCPNPNESRQSTWWKLRSSNPDQRIASTRQIISRWD
jgi:hypothetical protein